MGILGIVRATSDNIDRPIHECPEIWVNPDFIDRALGWSWKDCSGCACACDPCAAGLHCDTATCASTTLDDLVGQHFAYEFGDVRAVWRIDKADPISAGLILGRWPD